MTAVSITAANVKAGAGAQIDRGHNAGATLTAGEEVYLDPATQTYKGASANVSGAESISGTTLNGASSGQPIAVQIGGKMNPGGTLVAGTTYCVGETAGSLVPQSDLTTGDHVLVVGIATGTSELDLHPNTTGVVL